MIPHNRPSLGAEEERAVSRVLASGWVAEGPEVEQFENEFCDFLDIPHGSAIALSSGTASLYLALLSLGIAEGDEVIIPTYVCSAVLNAIHMAKATPVLADIEPETLNISVSDVLQKKTSRTKALVITHTYGNPADVTTFSTLGVPIIEDCAQALGAQMDGQAVGLAGAASVYSFYASKMITTGYGGMFVSREGELIERVRDYRAFDGRETYTPRFNFHLSDINAAVGREQLKKLPQFLARRKEILARYRVLMPGLKLLPLNSERTIANGYRILLECAEPTALKENLAKQGISTIVPLEQFELLHRYRGQPAGNFPMAEQVVERYLSLPAYPSLSDAEIQTIAAAVLEGVARV